MTDNELRKAKASTCLPFGSALLSMTFTTFQDCTTPTIAIQHRV